MPESLTCRLEGRLANLLWLQFRGRMRRSWKRLCSPRRLVPTLLVGLFLSLYVVQIYIAIALNPSRETFDVRTFAPLGMLGILTLKLLGVGIDRTKSGAGFRDVEIHQLLGGPFSLSQVRLFRVYGHAVSIFFTSVFAAIFFRFHVPSFAAALVGAYLAMIFTYLVHSLVAVTAVNIRESTYRWARNLACGLFIALLALVLYRVAQRGVSNLDFLRAVGDEALVLAQTPIGCVLTAPFQVFTNIVAATNVGEFVGWLVPGILLNFLVLTTLLHIESRLERRSQERERFDFRASGGNSFHSAKVKPSANTLTAVRCIPWLGGAGPIVWRQVKAVARLKSGLSWLLVPLGAVLALGCYIAYDPAEGAFLTIAVTVVLSSVFLPGLLPFDFRGDLQGLSALKMMPIRPTSVVAGQLAVPICILSLLQGLALSTLVLHDRALIGTVALTMCFLLPTNTIIMALENVIFLLFPYRLAEFDMQATVRRIVMLMAKFCVVFVAAVVSILVGFGVLGLKAAAQWIPAIAPSYAVLHTPLLIGAQLTALATLAAMVVWSTCWAYRRFDLNQDLPL